MQDKAGGQAKQTVKRKEHYEAECQSVDLNDPHWIGDDVPFSYHIMDNKTVNTQVLFVSFGFSVDEDDAGPFLLRFDTGDIYRKTE